MDQRNLLRVSGSGVLLLVPAIAIAALALFMPMYLEAQGATLPVENVQRVRYLAAAAVLVLVIAAIFCSTRFIEVTNKEFVYGSWFGRKRWPVAAFSDVTYEHDIFPELVDNGPFHWVTYLRLWRGERQKLNLNTLYWRKSDLAKLVHQLKLLHPHVQIGPNARRFLDMK